MDETDLGELVGKGTVAALGLGEGHLVAPNAHVGVLAEPSAPWRDVGDSLWDLLAVFILLSDLNRETTLETTASETFGAVVSLHRSEAPCLASGAPIDTDRAAVVLARAGVRDGQPFALGADGGYDAALNRFFRELDSWGVRAANSVAAYARDVTVFCRFLHESRGAKTIWACDEADLRAYKQLRLRGPQHMRVSVATWRRFIAAIDKWAAWSLSEGLIQREPFSYREKSVWTPVGARRVHINTASEPQPGPAPIRFVSYPDYLIWRDVGLRGRLLDGRADPCFHGRHAARDSAFADMVVSTGMRLGEAASLLVPELPPAQAEGAGRLRGIHLAGAVTKRGRPRTVFAPARVLRALGRYVAIERSALVTAGTAGDGYRLTTQAILVRRAGTAAVMLPDSSSRSYSKLDPTLRSRLVLVDDDGQVNGPLALWLGEHGRPVSPASWQSVFRRANLRCAEAGLELKCSPHTLRHVFAVHMLGLLLRQSVAALGADPSRRLASTQLRALLVGNPLRKLQLLLGHANEATVYAYLDVLDEAQEIVAAALENWDSESGALDSAPTGDQAILAAQA